jgi:hypothetical protein
VKPMTIILSLAISIIAIPSAFTPASAYKMDGRYGSSDGGRSYRYRMAMMRGTIPQTCSAYAGLCIRLSSRRPDRYQTCSTAKARCLQTGVHVGPYSHQQVAGLQKM